MFKFLPASVAFTFLIITQQLANAQIPSLQVSPATDISVEGASKGTEFKYALSSATGSVGFFISGIPSWLNASFTTGTATTLPLTVTFTVRDNARTLAPGSYSGAITFINTTNGQGTQQRKTTLTVIDVLNRAINEGLADPKLKARFAELSAAVLPGSPADFSKLVADETEKWGKVVKASGAKPE
jgi:hypothetical protein